MCSTKNEMSCKIRSRKNVYKDLTVYKMQTEDMGSSFGAKYHPEMRQINP